MVGVKPKSSFNSSSESSKKRANAFAFWEELLVMVGSRGLMTSLLIRLKKNVTNPFEEQELQTNN